MMVGFAKHFLSRCLPVQINRDKRIQYIRNPGGHSRAEVAVDGEGRCDGGEEDVGETQGQSDADVQPHASFDLAGRERGSDGGQDEGGHDGGKTFVVFDLECLDIADPSFLLAVDIRGQFGRSHRLAVSVQLYSESYLMEFAVRREIIFLSSKCSKEKRYPIPERAS